MLIEIVIGLAAIYLILIAVVYFGQTRMVFFPFKEVIMTPSDIGLQFNDISLKTEDGISISAWHIPSHKERGVVLFCHGNAGNISHRLDSIRIFNSLNLGVLIFDYRGFGNSEGRPTENGTYLDAEAAWTYLVDEMHIKPDKIILFGRSIGSAVAAEIALRHRAGALILESAFTSIPELGQELYPFLPVRLLSRFRYDTIRKAGSIDIPKLIIHSADDEIIPFKHGRRLFEEAAEPKEFLKISGNHNEGFLMAGETYKNGLDSFILKYF